MITRKQPVSMVYSKALIKPDGEVLNYSDTSSGNEVLVFIHGYPFDQSIWKEQAIALSEQARIITYDVRGYGSSSKGTEKYSIDLFIQNAPSIKNLSMEDNFTKKSRFYSDKTLKMIFDICK